jgi:hypothetical protein
MRAPEHRRIFPALDTGPYPDDVQTDHEIWRGLPNDIRDAAVEAISALEKQLASAKKTGPEEKEFHNELRAALMVAVGVLQEAAMGARASVALTSNRTGNA